MADSSSATASSSSGVGNERQQSSEPHSGMQRRQTILPSFSTGSRVISSTNDGVFANLAAKPERGEKTEDLPPVCIYLLFRVVNNAYSIDFLLTPCV